MNNMKKLIVVCISCFLNISSFAQNEISALCPNGSLLGTDGKCHECTSLKTFETEKLADCSNLCKSSEGVYIRKSGHFINTCELVVCPDGYQKDTFGNCVLKTNDTCPEHAPLKDKNGFCHPCSELEYIDLETKSDCEVKCNIDGVFLRKTTFWGCVLEKCPENTTKDPFDSCIFEPQICTDSHPLRKQSSCYNCAYEKAIDMSPNDIHLCNTICTDEQGNPTRKIYNYAGCGLINCPQDKPLMANGSCYSCDEAEAISNAQNCDICPKRTIITINQDSELINYCALSACTPDKPLRDLFGSCYSCDEDNQIAVKNGSCTTVCPNRVETEPSMFDYVLSIDKEGTLCSLPSETEDIVSEISINVTNNETLLEPKFKQSHCSEDKPLMDYQGGCYACEDPSVVMLELSDLCLKCPNRDLKKITHYSNEGKSLRYECKISNEKSL